MTRDKDLKRLVRARMQKTGESYTAARSRIVGKAPRNSSAPSAAVAAPEPATPRTPEHGKVAATSVAPAAPDYAKIAGMSDEAVKAKTGCDWARWVHALDRRKAHEMSHREIAAVVNEKYGIDGWWSQMVTVGYERIKGLRERGQRRDGGFEASKSKSYNVPVEQLYDAWALARHRRRWLTDAEPKVRSTSRPKSLRLALEDGTTVALWFMSKGERKSSVSVQHLGLPDRAAADRSKQLWGERLEALAERLRGR
jgi:hypothetical protein